MNNSGLSRKRNKYKLDLVNERMHRRYTYSVCCPYVSVSVSLLTVRPFVCLPLSPPPHSSPALSLSKFVCGIVVLICVCSIARTGC